MSSKTKASPKVDATVGSFPPVDGSHKELLEATTGTELSKSEWASIRQCLRCLVQGVRLVKKENGAREVTSHHSAAPMDTTKAIAQIVAMSKKTKGDVLKAARKLTFIDE